MTESKPKIMIVDDDPGIGKLLTTFLGERNYQVLSFSSALSALVYLTRLPRADAEGVIPRNDKRASCHCEPQRGEAIPTSNGGYPPSVGTGVNLLLTDLQMPEMTGIELAQQVKTLYPVLPVIVMSGSADGPARDEILALGADFIAKPFDLADLLIRIDSRITHPACSGTNSGGGER